MGRLSQKFWENRDLSILTIIKLLFGAVITYRLGNNVYRGYVRRSFLVFWKLKPEEWVKLILLTVIEIAVVLKVGIFLMQAWPVGFGFSWLQIFANAKEKEQGTNLVVAMTQFKFVGLIFLVLLFVNLPILARTEENMFRRGTKNWGEASFRSLKFGLAHCLVGVPIGFGLALGIAGMWFSYQYFKGGVRRSTLYHSTHNMILASVLLYFILHGSI